MDHKSLLTTITIAAALCSACSNESPEPKYSFHFYAPASIWEETLPSGNGRMGIMPDGGTVRERFVLNEISTWNGSAVEDNMDSAWTFLPKIRELLFADRCDEAQTYMAEHFVCTEESDTRGGKSFLSPHGAYQLLGNLELSWSDTSQVRDYRRSIALDDAILRTEYARGKSQFSEEVFTSYSDDVAVIRLRQSGEPLSLGVSMDRKSNYEMQEGWRPVVTVEGGRDLVYRLRLNSGTEAEGAEHPEGMALCGRVRVLLPRGGSVCGDGDALKVENAPEAVILVALRTDYLSGEDYAEDCLEDLDKAEKLGYKKLEKRHTEAWKPIFGRADLDLGRDALREELPITDRLIRFYEEGGDPSLAALYYQYGRYLLMSATRPGSLPPNLQGLWANTVRTPWNGDYHLNINLQMNYWPAESGNLSEYHLPLAEYVKSLVPDGEKTAKAYYNSRGWVCHIVSSLWGFTAPGESPSWGATHTPGAWLCQHLYTHYEYTGDKEYLADIYPVLKGAATFYVDMMVEDPRNGYLVAAPTSSPENSYYLPNGNKANVCAGSTMDNQIIRELFTNTIASSGILGIDKDFADTLSGLLPRIKPSTAGPDGRLMEWMEPYEETDRLHRHISHLYGFYPGNEITVDKTPQLAEAVKKTLETKGDLSTGWAIAWRINCWARLQDGNHAYRLLKNLLRPVTNQGFNYSNGGGSYSNMFCAHPPFQIDGNYGGAAGIAEMLLQSHQGYISIIPAIPDEWKAEGSFRGLCARPGAEVSAAWKDSVVTSATLKARCDGEFYVKGLMDSPVSLRKGDVWKYNK